VSNHYTVTPIHDFSRRLQALRHARGLSQVGLAKAAGISRNYLARVEIGRHWPSLEMIERLARALKVKPAALLEYDRHLRPQKGGRKRSK
jgi:transcriptional regulator with XRE-family HTH domain